VETTLSNYLQHTMSSIWSKRCVW